MEYNEMLPPDNILIRDIPKEIRDKGKSINGRLEDVIAQSNEIATVKDVKGVKDFKWSLEHEDGKLYFNYEEA